MALEAAIQGGSGAILKAANFFTPQKKSQAAEISAHAPLQTHIYP